MFIQRVLEVTYRENLSEYMILIQKEALDTPGHIPTKTAAYFLALTQRAIGW